MKLYRFKGAIPAACKLGESHLPVGFTHQPGGKHPDVSGQEQRCRIPHAVGFEPFQGIDEIGIDLIETKFAVYEYSGDEILWATLPPHGFFENLSESVDICRPDL